MEIADADTNTVLCEQCSAVLKEGDKFCGNCGKPVKAIVLAHHHSDIFERLSPVLLYYLITLILLSVYKFTDTFEQGFNGMVVVSIINIAIVIFFWINNGREVKPLFSFKGFRFKIAMLTIVGALIGSMFISFLTELINVSISDDVFYNPYLFNDTQFPLIFSVLFICVQPAIFEEVTFRGFLFNNLEKVSSPIGAVYITSFVFGIIHLALISMLWLVPIGLAFAFLRMRYNTLWYGVIGHFTHNLGIVLLYFLADKQFTL